MARRLAEPSSFGIQVPRPQPPTQPSAGCPRSICRSEHFDVAEDVAFGASGAAHSRLALSHLSILGDHTDGWEVIG